MGVGGGGTQQGWWGAGSAGTLGTELRLLGLLGEWHSSLAIAVKFVVRLFVLLPKSTAENGPGPGAAVGLL